MLFYYGSEPSSSMKIIDDVYGVFIDEKYYDEYMSANLKFDLDTIHNCVKSDSYVGNTYDKAKSITLDDKSNVLYGMLLLATLNPCVRVESLKDCVTVANRVFVVMNSLGVTSLTSAMNGSGVAKLKTYTANNIGDALWNDVTAMESITEPLPAIDESPATEDEPEFNVQEEEDLDTDDNEETKYGLDDLIHQLTILVMNINSGKIDLSSIIKSTGVKLDYESVVDNEDGDIEEADEDNEEEDGNDIWDAFNDSFNSEMSTFEQPEEDSNYEQPEVDYEQPATSEETGGYEQPEEEYEQPVLTEEDKLLEVIANGF